jgi:formylglycine-generating enzyme required for sulfatase activity
MLSEVHNNARNLQFPLDDLAGGFNAVVDWAPTAPAKEVVDMAPAVQAVPENYPAQQHGNTVPSAEPVGARPGGASPFGVEDMVGSVWQYTSEFQDNHTRYVIVKGGSNYRPAGSKWYFPNQMELDTHNKYLLMGPRYERAGTVGFRCVVDAAGARTVVPPPSHPHP